MPPEESLQRFGPLSVGFTQQARSGPVETHDLGEHQQVPGPQRLPAGE